ncbi:mitochondrial enolase superfamily member 1 [Hyalella azteca]|uniref:Mitochondrial enolase superfamily member 1 n=1 Tax=Hyalella azteca TaxID=294128 RepID=A0A979FJQ2_HYAAZ|nr:mitochondrial enolase superfamily member 1 [Hyalella azteca]
MSDNFAATRVRALSVRDIRFPTSLENTCPSEQHPDPDYSCAYVTLFTDTDLRGHGLCFTLGRGTELVVSAVKSLARLVVGRPLSKLLYGNMRATWHSLVSESQLRWVGPEKGVVHLAVGAVVNALWDLWARLERVPLWKLLVDMDPQVLVSTIDFTYITDALTEQEALQMLQQMQEGKQERENFMLKNGYPAYTTAAGWIEYSDEKIRTKCEQFLARGWRHFKLKVGLDLQRDKERCRLVRDIIGFCRPLWIEEPTSPDDILGHATIADALRPLGIGVATGEACQNRVVFKQLLQAKAIDFCQIDACRVGGVSEVLAIYLMAKKFNVPVCPHAGGVGLCQMVQHLQMWDYVSLTGTTKNRVIEYVPHLEEHFKTQINVTNCRYFPPKIPGYSVEMWAKSLQDYEYPAGPAWKKLYAEGKFPDPAMEKCPLVERPIERISKR